MNGVKILVVDDSPSQLRMTSAALEGQNFEIITAVDGEDALHRVSADRPDLVVLDVVMPKIDGFQVCRKMKSSSAMQHIPVIILSSKNQKVDEFWGRKQGADMYLTKPFDKEQLLAAVKKYLS